MQFIFTSPNSSGGVGFADEETETQRLSDSLVTTTYKRQAGCLTAVTSTTSVCLLLIRRFPCQGPSGASLVQEHWVATALALSPGSPLSDPFSAGATPSGMLSPSSARGPLLDFPASLQTGLCNHMVPG